MSAFKNPSAKRCRRAAFLTEADARAAEIAKGPPWRARLCHCGRWHLVSDETTRLTLTDSLARAALAGRKTTHRIAVGRVRHCPYRVGGEYLIGYQDGTNAPDAVAVVTAVDRKPLLDIDDDAAIAEGFSSFAAFLDHWVERYEDQEGLTPRRADVDVWVLTFRVEHRDIVHLLNADAGQAYTTTQHRALVTGEIGNLGPVPEPEAPDPASVADLPSSREAKRRYRQAKVNEIAYLEQLPLPERIRRIHELAAEKRIDVSGPMKGVEHELKRALNRLRRAA